MILQGKRNSKRKSVYCVRGVSSPVISNLVLDGLEAVVHGNSGHRRVHNINYVRWADDFIGTATSRQELAEVVQPRIEAF